MKKVALFILILFAGLYLSSFASASVQRVYGSCEMTGARAANLDKGIFQLNSYRKGWWDYAYDTERNLWFSSKSKGLEMGFWSSIYPSPAAYFTAPPSGGYFVDYFKEGAWENFDNPYFTTKDCAEGEGCSDSVWPGVYTDWGFLEYGCMDQACNYDIDKWKAIPFTKKCNFLDNSITYTKNANFIALEGAGSDVTCSGFLQYTEKYDVLPEECKECICKSVDNMPKELGVNVDGIKVLLKRTNIENANKVKRCFDNILIMINQKVFKCYQ